jgi:5-methylcytosine-specific restriction enzyme subunit McrC
MAIPVANIYYLLCYAWDEFAPQLMNSLKAEHFPDALHLFSRMLVLGIARLQRRGLETGYVGTEEPTSVVRGRIVIGRTLQIRAQQPQRLVCVFDEMSSDILSNQILKATLRAIIGVQELDANLRAEIRRTYQSLTRVTDIDLCARIFHEVRLHQNNRLYSFLINICRFFFESLQACEQSGQYRFRGVERDEKRMRRVFEKFVRNFFRRRQHVFVVAKERMQWEGVAADGSDLALLPLMETDVTLRSEDRTIVIECKYTESLYQSRFFAEKFRAAHLYQLSSYLRNLEARTQADCRAEGILLYPTAGIVANQWYRLHGHSVRIKTIDLAQPWGAIEEEMLAIVTNPSNCSDLLPNM